jgi:hypothetical protein
VFVLSRVAASAQEDVVLQSSKWEAIRLQYLKCAGKIVLLQKNPAALQSKASQLRSLTNWQADLTVL